MLLGNTPGSRAAAAYGTVTRYGGIFQNLPLAARFITPRCPGRDSWAVPRPRTRNACRLSHAYGLASSPFAHHYSGNRGCFLFLRVLRCFTSPRYHPLPYAFRQGRRPITAAGFPHSETPGSQPGCRLPGAYRRLQRPSSAPGAKASTVCPYKLGTTKPQLHIRREPPAPEKGQGAPGTRCSRPLCSSQETDSTASPRPEPGTTASSLQRRPGHTPASSGPNSVPTQDQPPSPRSGPPQKGNRTSRRRKRTRVNSQRSTRKHKRPVSHPLAGAPAAP